MPRFTRTGFPEDKDEKERLPAQPAAVVLAARAASLPNPKEAPKDEALKTAPHPSLGDKHPLR